MSGPALALFVTLLLEGFFIFRFARTLKFFPSALFSLLSLFVIILIAFRMRKQRIKPFSTIKELF